MEALEDLGYKKIGVGSFADVYGKKRSNRVLKIGGVNGDSYLRYVERVGLMSTNVHFPKIHSVMIYDTDLNDPYSKPYYVVEMEKLQPINEAAKVAKVDAIREYSRIKEHLGIYDISDLNECWIDNVFTQDTDFGNLVLTLKDLYRHGAASDVREANVMYRVGETKKIELVITDPVV
jgi:hypothetical protein